MPDYRTMYFELARAASKAIDILTEATLKCEEMYISAEEEEKSTAAPSLLDDLQKLMEKHRDVLKDTK